MYWEQFKQTLLTKKVPRSQFEQVMLLPNSSIDMQAEQLETKSKHDEQEPPLFLR
jgi:hypothetical protein